MVVIQKLIT
ncbi:hypothetical protein FWK35_00030524 [Aphis craccivora]|uniref:Uncharacterized protein n=1 Tax=Aphis craccivora TaxID=307492 RepID=A0A6G0XZZ6_APHCR|nr:hypothetical protein FWK35_00015970 [Aphis craccivora]KAF0746589.1 hypothetical protein FWK35_00030524 [Aphis craccivora]